jgi:hypothetical protein
MAEVLDEHPEWLVRRVAAAQPNMGNGAIPLPRYPIVIARNRREQRRVENLIRQAGPDLPTKDVSLRMLRKHVYGLQQRRAVEAARNSMPVDWCELHAGDFRDHVHRLKAESAALALVDGPWTEYATTGRDIAEALKRVLKLNANVAVYTGCETSLEWTDVFRTAGYTYVWDIPQVYGDAKTVKAQAFGNRHTTIYIFRHRPDGAFRSNKQIIDVVDVDDSSKEYHPWQQPVSTAEMLVRGLSSHGDLVVDLTMGTGTTAVACSRVGLRRFFGTDLNPNMIPTALDRVAREG